MSDFVGYASVKPILNPNNNVLGVLEKLKLPKGIGLIPMGRLHCTLMYDERNNQPMPSIPGEVYPATITGVAVLGKAVVLLLASDGLSKRHFDLLDKGFKYSHDNFAPHLSVVYAESIAIDKLESVRRQVQQFWTERKLPTELYLTDEMWKPAK